MAGLGALHRLGIALTLLSFRPNRVANPAVDYAGNLVACQDTNWMPAARFA